MVDPVAGTAPAAPPAAGATGIPFAEALRVWARIALLSFGGPAGQIAVMHRILVEEKRWIGDLRFLHALNFCMLLPGPEAQQLAVYVGWLLHRTAGGIAAGVLFVLPGALAIMALSVVYALYGDVGVVRALLFGLKAAVLAIVLQAVVRIGRRALHGPAMAALALAAFVAIFAFAVPFPAIIAAAALIGAAGSLLGLWSMQAAGGHGAGGASGVADADTLLGDGMPAHARPDIGRAARVGGLLLLLWLAPVALLSAGAGGDGAFADIAVFFSKMAVVTFGGAYAVLAYVAQEAVGHYGWLAPGEMLDGLGMAETTPGPLIMVTQFVGFLAAFRDPGGLPPVIAGVVGGLLTTWVTFVPCFLWILLGAPFVEQLRRVAVLSAALSAITAAVVGVVLNLAVWFGLHVLFGTLRPTEAFGLRLALPVWASVDPAALGLTMVAFLLVFALGRGMVATLGVCAALGLGLHLLGLAG